MRTTVEITSNQRVELLRLAAQRGLKGFSVLVQEALNKFLDAESGRKDICDEALSYRGVLKGKDADDLQKRTKSIRNKWR